MDRRLTQSRIFAFLITATLAMAAGTARADSLDARIRALLGNAQLKGASVGVDVVEITPKGAVELFAHNATTPLGPASNTKLLTTAAAFEKYGPKAVFKTHLYKVGDDLLVIGGGDPALCDAKVLSETYQKPTSPTAPFEAWAEQLKAAGIVSFRNLIVDDRVFDHTFVHPDWPADQALSWYCAPVGGLNFNNNCLDWIPKVTAKGVSIELFPVTSYVSVAMKATRGKETRVWLWRPTDSNKFEMRGTVASSGTEPESVSIVDPGLWTGAILRDVLIRNGIASSGSVRRAGDDERFPTGQLVASHETPLLAVIRRANKNSVNMMAEALCKRLGHDATGKPGDWTNGPAAVTAYAENIGVEKDWLTLDDGCGLSSKNRIAAKAFTTVLAHVAMHPQGDQFVESLAIPGEEGTLKRRFNKLPVAAAVHAKTGHIAGVSTLSGYIDISADAGRTRRFAFSILCNKYQGNVNPWQDAVCQAIYEWAGGK